MNRMRTPVRRAFAAQWINYRWHGAPEPNIPHGWRSWEVRALIANMGGHRGESKSSGKRTTRTSVLGYSCPSACLAIH
jgi:hypothetical protein